MPKPRDGESLFHEEREQGARPTRSVRVARPHQDRERAWLDRRHSRRTDLLYLMPFGEPSPRSHHMLERERHGLVHAERAALLPRLRERGFAELRADIAQCLFVQLCERPTPGAALIAQSLKTGEEAGGRPSVPLASEHAGETAQVHHGVEEIAKLAVDAKARPQHRGGLLDSALADGDLCECTHRARLDALVARRACPTKIVLMESAGALVVTDSGAQPRERAGHQESRVLVAEFTEDTHALLVELLRS